MQNVRSWVSLAAVAALSMAAAAGTAREAAAAAYGFDLGGGFAASQGPEGNSVTFTSGGLSVTARAYNTTSTFGAYSAAYLGAYQFGLGVTTGEADNYPMDNGGGPELVIFQFSAPVLLQSVSLFSGGVGGADATFFFGTAAAGKDFTGVENTQAGLGLAGLGSFQCSAAPGGDCESFETITYQPNVNGLIGNTLVVETYIFGFDALFLINGLQVADADIPSTEPGAVPEPGTVALLGGALAALGFARRRRA